ncbi:MAG: tRNA lysidine(34) synthetase TilS [Deltaproteobacteria bacterium]|jgi:tRNA(Ile)-lysidine synthetase-like protein|nr:tRNA lysidine(34) synthetase TilS [Deltaproteobacteria bacterium]
MDTDSSTYPPEEFPERFARSLAALAPDWKTARFVLALSGGRDSMALAAAMAETVGSGRALCATLDHGIREGSAQEAELVAERARAMGFEALVARADVPAERDARGKGLEEAGRHARYRFLEEARRGFGADWILTGHHADDNAETIVMKLIRGAGPGALMGVPARSGRVLRPLLRFRGIELGRFLRGLSIGWVEDPSNSAGEFLRNAVRHSFMPSFLLMNPRFVEGLGRASELASGEEDFWEGRLDSLERELVRPTLAPRPKSANWLYRQGKRERKAAAEAARHVKDLQEAAETAARAESVRAAFERASMEAGERLARAMAEAGQDPDRSMPGGSAGAALPHPDFPATALALEGTAFSGRPACAAEEAGDGLEEETDGRFALPGDPFAPPDDPFGQSMAFGGFPGGSAAPVDGWPDAEAEPDTESRAGDEAWAVDRDVASDEAFSGEASPSFKEDGAAVAVSGRCASGGATDLSSSTAQDVKPASGHAVSGGDAASGQDVSGGDAVSGHAVSGGDAVSGGAVTDGSSPDSPLSMETGPFLVSLRGLSRLHLAEQRRLLGRLVRRVKVPGPSGGEPAQFGSVEMALDFAVSGASGGLDLPGGRRVERRGGDLYLGPASRYVP